jgi:hypothetical protein
LPLDHFFSGVTQCVADGTMVVKPFENEQLATIT